MNYRYKGIPADLFSELPRLNTMSIPGALAGAPNTPPVSPDQARQDVMSRIAGGLGESPEFPVSPEAAQGLAMSPGAMSAEQAAIDKRKTWAMIAAIASLFTGGVTAPVAAMLASGAGARENKLRGEIAAGEERTGKRAKESREERELEGKLSLWKSQEEENRATAQMRKNRDAAANEARKFEARLIELQRKFQRYKAVGREPSPSELEEYNFTIDGFNAANARSMSLTQMMFGAMAATGAIPGGAMPQAPTLPHYQGGAGAPAPPAGAAGIAPGGAGGAAPRVRVQGPNGETGTIDAGDELPAGWRIIK